MTCVRCNDIYYSVQREKHTKQMLTLPARRSHTQIFSVFYFTWGAWSMPYTENRHSWLHREVPLRWECQLGRQDKRSISYYIPRQHFILWCFKENLYLKCVFYFTISCGWDGRMGWGGESLQSRCRESQKHSAHCECLHAVSGSSCAHTGTLAWISFLEVFSRSVEIYKTVSRTQYH